MNWVPEAGHSDDGYPHNTDTHACWWEEGFRLPQLREVIYSQSTDHMLSLDI